MTIQETRIQPLNQHDPAEGEYVLYWMQQSQRAACNPGAAAARSR